MCSVVHSVLRRSAWDALFELAIAGPEGLASLGAAARVCPDSVPASPDDAMSLALWLQSAFDFIAMGNFPYPSECVSLRHCARHALVHLSKTKSVLTRSAFYCSSFASAPSYLTNGGGVLPAWPMRAACAPLSIDGLLTASAEEKVSALAAAAAVFYNATGDAPCFSTSASANDATVDDGRLWDWQACTESASRRAPALNNSSVVPSQWRCPVRRASAPVLFVFFFFRAFSPAPRVPRCAPPQ